MCRPSIKRVLDQLLHRGCRTFDNFAGGNSIDDMFGKTPDGHAASSDFSVRRAFASFLPVSTAGWPNGLICHSPAVISVSKMKCIIKAPRVASSSRSVWKIRTGRPASWRASAVDPESASRRSPIGRRRFPACRPPAPGFRG